MPVSTYFHNQSSIREQALIDDFIIESIKNHGTDVYYLPRKSQTGTDEIFGDDPLKAFNVAVKIEMYLESSNDFTGNQEFFSKFGLEIQKGAKVAVAKRTFDRFVGKPHGLNLPKEGDLIWLPIQQKMLEIKFVEEEKNFFQAGRSAPYLYGLSIETFKYNGEFFLTGIGSIDAIFNSLATATEYTMLEGGIGSYNLNEVVVQGTTYGVVASWNNPTRKLKLRHTRGEFNSASPIVGLNTGAEWYIDFYLDPMENVNSDYDDNLRIELEADNVLDWTELNPFGMPNE